MNLQFFNGSSKQLRPINLSGGESSTGRADVLQQAAARRLEREGAKRQEGSVRSIQRVWRGSRSRRDVKAQWRESVRTGEVHGVEALARLVRGWGGEGVGSSWWDLALDGKPASLLLPLHSTSAARYAALLRQLALKILEDAARSPRSPDLASTLPIIPVMLTASSYASLVTEKQALDLCRELADFLTSHGGLALLAQALSNISPLDKKNALLPSLASTLSLLHSHPSRSLPAFVLSHVLPLPLLPNRLPISSLTLVAKTFPLASLLEFAATPAGRQVSDGWTREQRLSAVGNLAAFGVAKIAGDVVKGQGKREWCAVLAGLLGGLDQPIEAAYLSKGPVGLAESASLLDSDSDEDDLPAPRRVVPMKAPPPAPLDKKLLSHLNLLVSPSHILAILNPVPTSSALGLVLALLGAWPTRRETILSAVASKKGVMRELWRGEVRGSALMRKILDGSRGASSVVDALIDPSFTLQWPALLLLSLLHTSVLKTLTDSTFFSPSSPLFLSLDETVSLSSLWRNIAFALFWNAPPENSPKLAFGWRAEEVRTVCEAAMAAVYERDGRRTFCPPEHWLMTDTFDVKSFVEAAISEEEGLEQPQDEDVDMDHGYPTQRSRPTRKNLSKRRLAFMSPRLGVLNNIPQTVPFEVRVEIFRAFIRNDRARLGIDRYSRSSTKYHSTIRRGKVAEDGYAHLNAIGAGLKSTIAITFIDQFGQAEAGIDGGGVFKEFLTSLSTEVFNTDRGLWQATKQQELFPAPTSYARETHSSNWFAFIGRVLGKALYEGNLVDVSFAGFFLNKWLGRASYFDDLASLDEELYRGLVKLREYDGDVEDLALTFTVNVEEFGVTDTIELVPGGSTKAVTKENREHYVDLVAAFKLNSQIKVQSEAFFQGLADIIDPKWIRMFDQRELQMLVGGVDEDIDIEDLRRNSVFHGLSEQTEQAFWHVVRGFDSQQRRALVRFVTSCPRPPMLGFKELSPLFCVRAGANDETRLPSSATCVNMLKLPAYRNVETLRNKLLQAITSESGFDLS